MNAIIKYIFLITLVAFGSCKKIELPPVEEGEVVFNVSADSDSNPISIEAGKDNFVLFPEYFEDDKNVINFVARFQKDDCQVGCEEKLVFRIRDFQQNTGSNLDINTAIKEDFYLFEVPLEDTIVWDSLVPTVKLDLDASNSFAPNSNDNIYTWSFDNGLVQTFIGNPEFPDIDLNNFAPNQPFNIKLDLITDGGNGCHSSQIQNLQFQNANQQCKVSIEMGTDSTGLPTLRAVPTGKAPYLFFWNTNDTSQTISLNQNIDTHEVIFIDANGCKSTASLSTFGTDECMADFSANFRMANDTIEVEEVVENLFEFSKVIIEYTTEDGIFYSTENGVQNVQNVSFKILNVEEGELSQFGEPTKELNVRFTCQLFNEDGDVIEFSNGEGIISVAYPG